MPRAEQVRARAAIILSWIGGRLASFGRWFGAPARTRLRTALFFPIALAIVASAVLVGAGFPSSNRCATPDRTTRTVPSTTRARICTQGLVNPAILGR
jgi:polyferredoxin